MNRERLTILRDHLTSLPDERFDMRVVFGIAATDGNWVDEEVSCLGDSPEEILNHCGTVACMVGWTGAIFSPRVQEYDSPEAAIDLDLNRDQRQLLFMPDGYSRGKLTKDDAIAAIQSMLDSPADDALPIWPEKEAQ